MLGLLGGIAGVLLGRGVEEVFPSLINKIFEIKATTGWHFDAAIQGISVGLLTTLLFTLAAAGGDPQNSPGDDPAPWHGGSETPVSG